ncbi:HIT family protein [Leifsonia sp. CL154]|uniref:HIT family protein n=1 Tax=Leifsonia sp. CL154 TaxID=1798214 RepID=UPI0034A16AF3
MSARTSRRLCAARHSNEGINLLVCVGAAAFQTVFHLHLHVIPRYSGGGFCDLGAEPEERDIRIWTLHYGAPRRSTSPVGQSSMGLPAGQMRSGAFSATTVDV